MERIKARLILCSRITGDIGDKVEAFGTNGMRKQWAKSSVLSEVTQVNAVC
jgi:hypothetical protein